VQDAWSQKAQEYYDDHSGLKGNPRRYRNFVSAYQRIIPILELTTEDSLLDVGCGCGELAAALEEKVRVYCGLDISAASLQIARLHNPQAQFVQADMTTFEFREQFDCAVALTSLEFCRDKAKALQQVFEVLNEQGKLYAEMRNADFVLFRIFQPLMGLLVRWGLVSPYSVEGFRDLSVPEWTDLLQEAGFQIVHLRKSVRPASYGGLLTRLKNTLIRVVRLVTPVRWHYMVGFVCRKR